MPELDRRDFLKLTGASAGVALSAGCGDPVEKLIPYVIQPEEITPGIPVIYASTCRECPSGCGIHVRTREGRPIKLEGNPEHPVNRGALCARGQVSITRSYHPDRYPGPRQRGADGTWRDTDWDTALSLLASQVKAAGAGTFVLGGDPGPTASDLLDRWLAAVVGGGRLVYEPFAPEALRAATKVVFGVEAEPLFDVSGADWIFDFGSDFLESGSSPTEHTAQFAQARDIAARADGGARLVYIGPRLSMTASNADEWIPAKPGTEGILALAVARVALAHGAGADVRAALAGAVEKFDVETAAAKTGVPAVTIERLGKTAAQAKAAVALPPGAALASRRATATAAAVLLLNAVLAAPGSRLRIPRENSSRPRTSYRDVLALIEAMKAGKVKVLLVHDANPLYSLPAASGFAEALERVPFIVSTAPLADEFSERAHLILPDHTPLESWGDLETRPGARSLVQPTLRPLYDTRALVDTLFDAARAMGEDVAAKLPEGNFRGLLERAWSGVDFRQALARGGHFSEMPLAPAILQADAARLEVAEPLLEGEGDVFLLAYPSPLFYDGRSANLGWLQEVGDPVTKVAWQSWVEMSHATAQRLEVETGDVVEIETTAGLLRVPVLPRGGIRDDVIAIPIGQGHTVGYYASLAGDGRLGEARGANVIAALPAATDEMGGRAWFSTKAAVRATGERRRLPFVQASDNKRGRMLAEVVPLAAVAAGAAGGAPHAAAHEQAAVHGGGSAGEHHEMLQSYKPADDAHERSPYRWGMSIDLDRCTGCNACVVACNVENSIPVIGEKDTLKSRQMNWLRIERYVGEGDREGGSSRQLRPDSERFGEVDVRHSPMLCQQCGAAPCESVCPVLATYHNDEGLNGMVYNRCVGTRYCSNNCPYKVRRFNYRDYARENWPGLMHLMLNPDVTLRQQGVMEKCTFCVQRIHAARQVAKDEKRVIRDGEVTTACEQACASRAITFGNLRDAQSRVAKKSGDPIRGYHALHELNTRPAITYLKQVKRGSSEEPV